MLSVLVAIVSAAGALWAVRRYQQEVEATWRRLAELLGLPLSADRRLIVGRVGGITVQVEPVTRETGGGPQHFVRALITSRDLVGGVEASSAGVFARLRMLLGHPEITVGDEEFDRRVHLGGDEDRVFAFFDSHLRHAFLRLVEAAPQAEITVDSRIVYERPGRSVDPRHFADVVGLMLDVARGLATTDLDGEVSERLAQLALEDDDAPRRQRALELLLRHHPTRPPTRRALDAALRDPSPSMRLLAARTLGGPEGFDVLRALVDDAPTTDERIAALATLIVHFPYPEVAPELETVLHTGRPELRAYAVRAIGNAHDLSRFEHVLRMRTHDDASLCEATATVLGQIGDARAEPRLLELLGHEEAPVRVAAARSLAIVGTVAAVEPLLSHTTGLTTPAALKEAARSSIRTIQARLGPVESGRLSMVEDDGRGALSLAGEGGALALADEVEPATGRRRERA